MSKVVKKIEIKNKLGVHARAAALLVQTVNKFSAQISLSADGQTTDGRSILGVMSLGEFRRAARFRSRPPAKMPKRR